jgi:hypothetical protein
MPEARGDEQREALVGTWFAVALIVELLIASEVAERGYIVALLSELENGATPERRIALSAIRKIIAMPEAPTTLQAVRRRHLRCPAETARFGP